VDDPTAVAALLLVIGPLLGAIPIAHPALLRVWSASREDYLATIGGHRGAWYLLNAGFTFATLLTSAGLAILAAEIGPGSMPGALLLAVAVVYALGGVPWVTVLAIRARRDPLLAQMVAEGRPTEPAESLLGEVTGGLFGAFVLVTGLALVAMAAVAVPAGLAAAPVAIVGGAIALLVLVVQIRTGDCIPAILYLPTLLLGIALIAGWR
jgi:hypothetical protein